MFSSGKRFSILVIRDSRAAKMSPFQMQSTCQPKCMISGPALHRREGFLRLDSERLCLGKAFNCKQLSVSRMNCSAACQANFRFHSHYSQASRFTNRLYQQGSPLGKRRLPKCAMAMEKMEVTDEEILQEKERIGQEEMFLGKEEEPQDTSESADEAAPSTGAVGLEMLECWDLWQRIGLPVQKIAKQRHMTETGVFYCIFKCIQNNYTVDWYELCKEAQFTSDIAQRMNQATEKFVANATGSAVELRTLRQHLPSDISEVHFGLYVTMLDRGLPYETIMEISFQTGGSKPVMEWGEEYADEERFPKEATESTLLQWFSQKDGASLIEIALKFRECDDLELMRLILRLEEDGKIFWRQGIFRAL